MRSPSGVAEWYIAATWDKENIEPLLTNAADPHEKNNGGTIVMSGSPAASRDAFISYVASVSDVLAHKPKVELISAHAAPQSAPPDATRLLYSS